MKDILKKAENLRLLMELLIATVKDAILCIDGSGRIILFNQAAEYVFGYTPQEAIGADIGLLVPGWLAEVEHKELRRKVQSKETPVLGRMLELQGRCKDGVEFPLELTLSACVADNQVVFLNIIRDVTEHRAAEEAKALLAALVESSSDAIIGTTTEGIILTWNKAAELLYGYAAEDVIGRSVGMIFPSERQEELVRILDLIRQGRSIESYDGVRVRKDGRLVKVSVTVSPIWNRMGRLIGASAIARDVGERKRIEEAFRHSREQCQALIKNAMDIITALGEQETSYDTHVPTVEPLWAGPAALEAARVPLINEELSASVEQLETELRQIADRLEKAGELTNIQVQPGTLEELQRLSPRERDILLSLLTNPSAKQIADIHCLSLHTVRNHLKSIFKKLGVHSQTELLTRLLGMQPKQRG